MYKLLLSGFLLLCATRVGAHDIGVTEVILQEQPNNHYQWRVETPDGVRDAISAPRLPLGCDFIKTENSETIDRVYFFRCDRSLGAADHIELPWRTELVMVQAQWLTLGEKRAVFVRENEVIDVALVRLSASTGDWLESASRYFFIGIEHILLGIDHLLFVLCILLLVSNVKKLVGAITAFTLAHSITLVLSFLGWVQLNSAPVEAAIALSIVILAWEVLRGLSGAQGFAWRFPWLVCGSFGLLHGLGFAGALSDVGVSEPEIPVALLFFNIGVEAGQLLFIAVTLISFFGVSWLCKQRRWFFCSLGDFKYLLALAVGSFASFWVLERSALIFLMD